MEGGRRTEGHHYDAAHSLKKWCVCGVFVHLTPSVKRPALLGLVQMELHGDISIMSCMWIGVHVFWVCLCSLTQVSPRQSVASTSPVSPPLAVFFLSVASLPASVSVGSAGTAPVGATCGIATGLVVAYAQGGVVSGRGKALCCLGLGRWIPQRDNNFAPFFCFPARGFAPRSKQPNQLLALFGACGTEPLHRLLSCVWLNRWIPWGLPTPRPLW
jgi:hypothetical protein